MNWLNKLVKRFKFMRWLVRNEHNLIYRGIGIYPFSFLYGGLPTTSINKLRQNDR